MPACRTYNKPKHPIVREAFIRPGWYAAKKHSEDITLCDRCPAGRLRCDALVRSGAVLPCENMDALDVTRMTQLYGADGAKRLMEVGNELAYR